MLTSNPNSIVIEKQLPISDKSKAALVYARIDIFKADVNNLSIRLYQGDISVGQWQETMKKMIRELHTATASIGKGGWDQMNYSDWGKLGNLVKDQYRYLRGFAEHIADNRDTISLGAIQARSRMYGDAAGYDAIIYQAHMDIISQLPWMPKDGSTECLVGCKCRWELSVLSKTKTEQTVRATWKLGEAEHCVDCNDREGHVEMLRLKPGIDVPDFIGSY